MTKLLKVSKLKKKYHTVNGEIETLKDISFSLNKGDFVSILGPSGCGKSTLLHILADNIKASSGDIIFKENIKIGYMLQQDALFPWLSIIDNVLLGCKIKKNYSKESLNTANKLLDKYGLKDFKTKYPDELSGGMRQRVALIRTLILNPDIILFDEPFSALDYQSRLTVSEDVHKIIKSENKTAIMVTHDLSEAISISDRILVLSKRPAIIKKELTISWDTPSSPINNRTNPKFKEYYQLLWKELDYLE